MQIQLNVSSLRQISGILEAITFKKALKVWIKGLWVSTRSQVLDLYFAF